MRTSNGVKNIRSNYPGWDLLAEYALNEIFVDNQGEDEFKAEFLGQSFRELGVPPDWIGNIELILTGFANEALGPYKHRMLELSGSIRIFCQKKMIVEANLVITSKPRTSEQTLENNPIDSRSGMTMNSGWGYFIIERIGDDAGSSEGPHKFFDLYLYEEGV